MKSTFHWFRRIALLGGGGICGAVGPVFGKLAGKEGAPWIASAALFACLVLVRAWQGAMQFWYYVGMLL